MKNYLTKEQQKEFEEFQLNKIYGRNLSPEGLKLVCEGLENNPEAIGKHFLEVLAKFRREGIVK